MNRPALTSTRGRITCFLIILFVISLISSAPSSAQRRTRTRRPPPRPSATPTPQPSPATAQAQPSPSPSPTPQLYTDKTIAEMRRLHSAVLSSDYGYKQTAHLCNNIGPRLSGSPQAAHAVKYVADEMRRMGLRVELEE